LALSMAALALAAAGCGGVESGRLVDYLDELEFDVPLETASYVSLGKFDIPIAAARQRNDHAPAPGREVADHAPTRSPLHVGDAVRMRLQFELTAETAPPYEQAVLEAAQRHRGAMNDAVLTVVRTSTVEELADPQLSAVKSRLSEITRPILGEERVRQLVLNELTANETLGNSHDPKSHAAKEESGGHH